MDIEKINKTQMVLLTLLISFVTSIVTGIVTITLMDQAPPGVTQTINRVVERTIERVIPAKQGAVITKTVVVKEEDFIAEAVEKNSQSLVLINKITEPSLGKQEEKPVGFGFLVNDGLFIITDKNNLEPNGSYNIIINEKTFPLTLFNDKNKNIALFKIVYSKEKENINKNKAATLIEASSLRFGQSVIALGQKEENKVSIGIVKGFEKIDIFDKNSSEATSSPKVIAQKIVSIKTNLNLKQNNSGGPMINTKGEVVGINIVNKDFQLTISSEIIQDIIKSALQENKK